MHRLRLSLPAALLLAGLLARPAAGQVQLRPTPANLPPAQTQAVAQPAYAAPPPVATYAPPPYVYQGYQGRAAGYLNGVANVIGAQGQAYQDYQSGRMGAQKVEQEKIKTRALLRQQERYEQSLQPTSEQVRMYRRNREIQRARHDPPRTEIWAGDSLNGLLKNIGDVQTRMGVRGPLVPLDSQMLRHINLSGGTSRGPSTVLRNGKLRWPLVLQEEIYAAERQQINGLLPKAIKEVQDGDLQLATYKGLIAAVGSLKARIDAVAPNMSLQDIMHAQRYADQINSAISLLRDPNAANYFNGKWEAKGSTVAELVDNMIRGGLSFAPAAETDRTAYLALYQAMATYDSGLMTLVRR